MKKLLLLLSCSVFFILFSCSEEPPQPKNVMVTARVNGIDRVFNTVNVNPEVYHENGVTYTDLEVTASINNSPVERISFVVEKYVKGPTASWYFAYFLHETAYPKIPGFLVNVSENNNHHLEGTFSGQVKADVAPFEIVDFEDGYFDIMY